MIAAGCDVGSLTSKAVLMKDGRMISSVIIKSKPRPQDSAEEVMNIACKNANIERSDIGYCVGTGYGRDRIGFVNEVLTEIACHGRGAKFLVPTAKTVVDIGGQDCKAIKLGAKGDVVKFLANDKCASGTGRFLEVMARVLNVNLDEMGALSAKAREPITFSSNCTVWAQADVIKYINTGYSIEDIGAGINNAMAARMAVLVNALGVENDVCMTGGVAKNDGVVSALESFIGSRIKRVRRADPQLAGAIGAALFAQDRAGKEVRV
jgi:(R)-2-hydroxyacyl-CoA dehydratese activating ATPase